MGCELAVSFGQVATLLKALGLASGVNGTLPIIGVLLPIDTLLQVELVVVLRRLSLYLNNLSLSLSCSQCVSVVNALHE